MRIIRKVKRTLRRAGTLEQSIIALLARATRPLSALDVVDELAAQGDRYYPSQVFRALQQLADRREVRRVELLKGYVTGPPGETISLLCRMCGSLTQVAASALFDELDALALHHGMLTQRLIVESSGLCRQCERPVTIDPPIAEREGGRRP